MGILSRFTRRRLELDEDDFREEIRAHLAIAAEERIADGADPEEARYAALREFGNVAVTTEAARSVWMPRWFEYVRDVTRDVRYAVRTLAKNRSFSFTVITVLAVGIGLNATVFTMLKGAIFSPLSGVEGSAALAVIVPETGNGRPVRVSYPDYQYLKAHDRAFSGLFGTVLARVNLGRGRGARQVWGELVTGNYFEMLGVRAQAGRTLLRSDEEAPGGHPVAVISDSLWRRDFGGDPAVVGKTVEVNGRQLTIVGVAAPRFFGTTVVYDVSVFVPVMMAPDLGFTLGSRHKTPSGVLSDPAAAFFYPQGYLRPGTSLAEASSQVQALWEPILRERGQSSQDRIGVVPFSQTPGGAPSYILPTLGVLTAMGLLVLLIVCANIAGLVTVRGLARKGEIAVRLALGATRTRIVRLLVIENVVLAAPGAILGVVLANLLIPRFVAYAERLAAPDRLYFNIDIDGTVIVFSAVIACACALVFGFVPALQNSRVDLVSVINEDASPRGAGRHRLRATLAVAQVAVSMLLLVGAGLVTRSLDAARRADPGFDPRHVVSAGLDVQQNGYDEGRGRLFYRRLLDAIRADTTIESATLGAHTPMAMQDTRLYRVALDGYEPARGEDLAFMSNAVAPAYFKTLRIPVLTGREFEDRDDPAGAPVAIVNQTLADRFWGGAGSAIGKRLRVADGEWRTVVGVAADVKYARVNEPPRPYVYLPFFQAYRTSMIVHARSRTTVDTGIDALVARVRAHVAGIDGELPIMYAKPMTEQMRGALIFFNLAAAMLFIFGTAGLALAALGTYGLISYTVRQSTHEIGVRLALGASRKDVIQQFVQRGIRLGAIGTAVGVLAAFSVSRLLGSVLYGVSAFDTLSFARAFAIVLSAVVIASLVPAWNAARTSPLHALRHQ